MQTLPDLASLLAASLHTVIWLDGVSRGVPGPVDELGKVSGEVGDYSFYLVNEVEEEGKAAGTCSFKKLVINCCSWSGSAAGLRVSEEAQARATVWLGSEGAVTPMHHDAMHNFYVQVSQCPYPVASAFTSLLPLLTYSLQRDM